MEPEAMAPHMVASITHSASAPRSAQHAKCLGARVPSVHMAPRRQSPLSAHGVSAPVPAQRAWRLGARVRTACKVSRRHDRS
mgnify:CR=1 FL=1